MHPLFIGTATEGFTLDEPMAIDAYARARHVYAIGQTGTGKTALLENMVRQMIAAGEGLAFIDPHGDAGRTLVSAVPDSRKDDLIYVDLADLSQPVGLNFMTGIPTKDRSLAAQNVVAAFKHVYGEDSWGPRMEYVFIQCARSLMDANKTLLAMPRLFVDADFRDRVMQCVDDPFVRNMFWKHQFPLWSKKLGPELTSPIDNKIGTVLSVPHVRSIICQPSNTIDLRTIMDRRKILIVSLQKGRVGEQAAALFGALLVSAIGQAAFSRADIDESERVPFSLICDEFQNFATDGFPLILSEARKYGLALTLAHQGLSQIPDKIRSSIFENCGTYLSFRIGPDDSRIMAKAFRRESEGAFLDLENYKTWYRPLVRGNPGTPKVVTTPPPFRPKRDRERMLIANSQRKFGKGQGAVERGIADFFRDKWL